MADRGDLFVNHATQALDLLLLLSHGDTQGVNGKELVHWPMPGQAMTRLAYLGIIISEYGGKHPQ